MAKLYITEYANAAVQAGTSVSVPEEPPLAEQTITIGASTQSAVFNAATRIVRLHTDGTCSVLFGTNPIATTVTSRIAAGQTQFHGVPRGASFKVAVVTNT